MTELIYQLIVSLVVLFPTIAILMRSQANTLNVLSRQYERLSDDFSAEKRKAVTTQLEFAQERGTLMAKLEINTEEIGNLRTRVRDLESNLAARTSERDLLRAQLDTKNSELKAVLAEMERKIEAAVSIAVERAVAQVRQEYDEQLKKITVERDSIAIRLKEKEAEMIKITEERSSIELQVKKLEGEDE